MPAPVMQSVYSSHVSRIGYDSDEHELIVEWDTGKVSAYSDVPPDVADEAMNAWSVGTFLNNSVKKRYEHRYVG
ncbi:MAG TPA: KTSC domain-containing protein [Stellaceae bacterium]|jgi:hypothetical protein|nr:KTSC domain-containing protein [Stellaceae bacterium]